MIISRKSPIDCSTNYSISRIIQILILLLIAIIIVKSEFFPFLTE